MFLSSFSQDESLKGWIKVVDVTCLLNTFDRVRTWILMVHMTYSVCLIYIFDEWVVSFWSFKQSSYWAQRSIFWGSSDERIWKYKGLLQRNSWILYRWSLVSLLHRRDIGHAVPVSYWIASANVYKNCGRSIWLNNIEVNANCTIFDSSKDSLVQGTRRRGPLLFILAVWFSIFINSFPLFHQLCFIS